MTVEEVYKGSLKSTVEIAADLACGGPDFRTGEKYLIYTSVPPNGILLVSSCGRSRRIEEAGEDLQFLKDYQAGRVSTHVYGTVRFRPDEPDDSRLGEAGRTPLAGVRVTLSGNGKQLTSTTSSLGAYSFAAIDPGKYDIDAEFPGYRINWAQPVELRADSCFEANVLMKVDRRVTGTIREGNGARAKDALIEMIPTDPKLERWQYPVLLDESDEDGHYAIDGVPPGEYLLGVNINSAPTKEHPYATVYYPNTENRSGALPIRVSASPSAQEFDIQVGPRLPLVTISGRLQTADGKPPRPEDSPQVRFKEPGLYGQIEQQLIPIDAEGRFEFQLCEGVTYSAFAFAGPPRSQKYSAPIEFTATSTNDNLLFTLDKSLFEFQNLRPK
jgi:hypothetical protein